MGSVLRQCMQDFRCLEEAAPQHGISRWFGVSEANNRSVEIFLIPPQGVSASVYRDFSLRKKYILPGLFQVYTYRPLIDGSILVVQESSQNYSTCFGSSLTSIEQGLGLWVQACEALAPLHQQLIAHCLLTPEKLLVNPATGILKISDLRFARLIGSDISLGGQNYAVAPSSFMAPELSGKLNCQISASTDIYSLAACFYYLFSGRKLFDSQINTELLHRILAEKPSWPSDADSNIPQSLLNLLMRLLDKNPSNRIACLPDLIRVLTVINSNAGDVNALALDPSNFTLESDNLYGRDIERQRLRELWHSVTEGGSASVYLGGLPGAGKSALVNDLRAEVYANNGCFIALKCEQFHIANSFDLVQEITQSMATVLLEMPEQKRQPIASSLCMALGHDGYMLTNGEGELQSICRFPRADFDVRLDDHKRLIARAMQKFMITVCKHLPCFIFFDDVQWASSDYIAFVRELSDAEVSSLAMAVAFRSNEISEQHDLSRVLENPGDTQHYLRLNPLNETDIKAFITSVFTQACDDLALFVAHASGGNPLHLHQIVKQLYDEGLIVFDGSRHCWQYTLEDIERSYKGLALDALFLVRMNTYADDAQALLWLSASLGANIDLALLAELQGMSRTEVFDALKPAIFDGFIVGEDKREESCDIDELTYRHFRFQHDKVQLAAYQLFPLSKAQKHHAVVACALAACAERYPEFSDAEAIAQHFNLASQDESNLNFQQQRGEANLSAGEANINKLNIDVAKGYFEYALSAYAQVEFDTSLETKLVVEAMIQRCRYGLYETSRLSSHMDDAERHLKALLQGECSDARRIEYLKKLALVYTNKPDIKRAHRQVMEALDIIGIRLPSKDCIENDIRQQHQRLHSKLEGLAETPLGEDDKICNIIDFLIEAQLPLFQNLDVNNADYLLALALEMSFNYGRTKMSNHAVLLYAKSVAYHSKDYATARDLANYSRRQFERKVYAQTPAMVRFWYALHLMHLNQDWRQIPAYYQQVYELGLTTGDYTHAGFTVANSTATAGLIGVDLVSFEELIKRERERGLTVNYIDDSLFFSFIEQIPKAMRGKTNGLSDLSDECFDEDSYWPLLASQLEVLKIWLIPLKIQLLLLEHRYDEIEKLFNSHQHLTPLLPTCVYSLLTNFYYLLSIIRMHKLAGDPVAQDFLVRFNLLAECSPRNFDHFKFWLEAEVAIVDEDYNHAFIAMDRAIAKAKETRFTHHLAYMHEQLFIVCERRGQATYAGMHLQQALHYFELWGANAKAAQLRNHTFGIVHINAPRSREEAVVSLDLQTVVSAQQRLMQCLSRHELFEVLLDVLTRYTGAQSAALILAAKAEVMTSAVGDGKLVELEQAKYDGCYWYVQNAGVVPVEEQALKQKIPWHLVAQTQRTQKNTTLDDVARSRFNPPERAEMPASAICIPLLSMTDFGHKGSSNSQLKAVLYLENRLLEGVFRPENLQILDTLLSQASITLANVDLIDHLQLAGTVYENTEEGIFVTNAKRQITGVNAAFSKITGFDEAQVLGKNAAMLRSDRHSLEFYREMYCSVATDGYWRGELWSTRKNGDVYPQWLSVSVVREQQGDISAYVYVFSDISKVKQTEKMLRHMAHYDPLTELPNRILLFEKIDQSIKRALVNPTKIAVLFIDLDRFKNINDSLGHPVGDEILKEVAIRLQQVSVSRGTAARLGGDEFVIFIDAVDSYEEVAVYAKAINNAMERPFLLDRHKFSLNASIGISIYPDNGNDSMQLIRNADTAMYRAKEQGGAGFHFYTSELTQAANAKLKLESQIKHALDVHQFDLYYQPQVDVVSGKIIGAEALIRWQHPEEGFISPDSFIPFAESTGLIVMVGEQVIRMAFEQMHSWREAGLALPRLAINISTRQFLSDDLLSVFEDCLTQFDVEASMFELEITEGALMVKSNTTQSILNRLKDMGFSLAIDDFGTGYSSLAYLRRFEIDLIKIDRTFIEMMDCNESDQQLVNAIVVMAHNLGIDVLAEGVENHAQLCMLKDLNCDFYQGFYLSKALPAEQFSRFLSAQV